jgi:hypothetical protein
MLAWGKNFMPLSNIFIDYFPGYNKFRAVTMTLVIAQFCIPLLGFLALRDIFNGSASKNELIRSLKIAAGITGGFLILLLIIPGIAGSFLGGYETNLPEWLKNALIADRKDLLKNDSLRSLVFIILSAGSLLAFILGKLQKNPAILIITVLIVLDLWTVDKRYLNSDRFERPSSIQKSLTPTAADAFILKDTSYNRVLNITVSPFNDNSPTSYFHKSIGGYHGAKMERYQELIDTSLIKNIEHIREVVLKNIELIRAIGTNITSFEEIMTAFNSTQTLNMLNTKYVIISPDVPPLVNQYALGNAWFVENPILVEDANMEISSINNFDPSKEAIIDKIFKDQINKTSYPIGENERIELVSYLPNELHYKYSANQEKLVVFSEIYYPAGWKCFIDNKESNYFRTDYVLRGMVVPEGDHEIKFVFEPASYIIGNKISLASSVLLILLLTGYFLARLRMKLKSDQNGAS